MVEKTIAVLSPTTKPNIKDIPIAPRIHDLDGKVIGFLWNSKPNGDLLLTSIKERLLERFQISGVKWHQKHSLAAPADTNDITELALASDMVINAIGD